MRPYLVVIFHVRTAVREGGVARLTQQRGQDSPVGSNRLAFQHIRFAMASVADVGRSRMPHRSKSSDEDLAIGTVPIADQIAGNLFPTACFRDLIWRSILRSDAL